MKNNSIRKKKEILSFFKSGLPPETATDIRNIKVNICSCFQIGQEFFSSESISLYAVSSEWYIVTYISINVTHSDFTRVSMISEKVFVKTVFPQATRTKELTNKFIVPLHLIDKRVFPCMKSISHGGEYLSHCM